MSRIQTRAFFLFLTFFSPLIAMAQFTGDIKYAGNGCPQSTISTSFTEDGGIASLIFDQFITQTSNKVWADRKQCTVSFKVNVPEGYRLSKVQAQLSGFMSLPRNSFGTFFAQVYSRDSENRVQMNGFNYRGFNRPFQDNVELKVSAVSAKTKKCPKRSEVVSLFTYIDLWVPFYKSYTAFAALDTVDTVLSNRSPSSYSVFLEPCSQ